MSRVAQSTACLGFARKWGYWTELFHCPTFPARLCKPRVTARPAQVKPVLLLQTGLCPTPRAPFSAVCAQKRAWPGRFCHEVTCDTRLVVRHSRSSTKLWRADTEFRI